MKPPEVIYLQWFGDVDPELIGSPDEAPPHYEPQDYESVSWCWEKIHPADLAYVRKDEVDAELNRLRKAVLDSFNSNMALRGVNQALREANSKLQDIVDRKSKSEEDHF